MTTKHNLYFDSCDVLRKENEVVGFVVISHYFFLLFLAPEGVIILQGLFANSAGQSLTFT